MPSTLAATNNNSNYNASISSIIDVRQHNSSRTTAATASASTTDQQPQQQNNVIDLVGIVLDLATAGDLRRAIRQRKATNTPFMEHEAGIMFIQILFAVHHCHAMGIMHRDIKTANVFVMEDGTLKLGGLWVQ